MGVAGKPGNKLSLQKRDRRDRPVAVSPGTRFSFGRLKVVKDLAENHTSGTNKVYIVEDLKRNGLRMACKVEVHHAESHDLISREYRVLRQLQGEPGIPRVYGFARMDKVIGGNFMTMELLGEDLHDIRKRAMRLKTETACFLARQMLIALQTFHNHGIIHRDVKPQNFCVGGKPETKLKVYLIDYGLARSYVDENGQHYPPRINPPFRGTTLYASVNAHMGKDLSRADDLWSLVYSVLQLVVGHLPWNAMYGQGLEKEAKEKAKKHVMDSKLRFLKVSESPSGKVDHSLQSMQRYLQKACDAMRVLMNALGERASKRQVPAVMQCFIAEIRKYTYYTRPDYTELLKILSSPLSTFGDADLCAHLWDDMKFAGSMPSCLAKAEVDMLSPVQAVVPEQVANKAGVEAVEQASVKAALPEQIANKGIREEPTSTAGADVDSFAAAADAQANASRADTQELVNSEAARKRRRLDDTHIDPQKDNSHAPLVRIEETRAHEESEKSELMQASEQSELMTPSYEQKSDDSEMLLSSYHDAVDYVDDQAMSSNLPMSNISARSSRSPSEVDVPAIGTGSTERADAAVPSTEGAGAAAANTERVEATAATTERAEPVPPSTEDVEAAVVSTEGAEESAANAERAEAVPPGTEDIKASAANMERAEATPPVTQDAKMGSPNKDLPGAAAPSTEDADGAPSNGRAEAMDPGIAGADTAAPSTGRREQEHLLTKAADVTISCSRQPGTPQFECLPEGWHSDSEESPPSEALVTASDESPPRDA